MPPKLSVVLPVWNGEQYLAQAIDSILRQTFKDFELIIIDDGSTDLTPTILSRYTDERLRIHRLSHEGIVRALNFGVSRARADWIARHDADDISRPERFAIQWEALRRSKAAVVCFADATIIGDWRDRVGRARFPKTKAFLALRLCYQSPIVHSTVIFQRQAFLRAGGYHPDERHAEDYALWGRLIELGDFVAISQPLLEFRVHPSSVSKQNLQIQKDLTIKIATQHCRQFMTLAVHDARRAYEALVVPPEHRLLKEWFWFVIWCLPRLRWKSFELYAWAAWQTLRNLFPLRRPLCSSTPQ